MDAIQILLHTMPFYFLQDSNSNVTTPTESNVLIHVFIDDLLENILLYEVPHLTFNPNCFKI